MEVDSFSNFSSYFTVATKAFYKQTSLEEFVRSACKLGPKDSLDLEAWDKPSIDMASEALKGNCFISAFIDNDGTQS